MIKNEKPEERALYAFRNNYNCAQAVVYAYLDNNEESAALIKTASGFGGGMGRLQKTCGAVTGSFMVLGSLYGRSEEVTSESKDYISAIIQRFNGRFLEKFTATDCRELLSYDLQSEEGKAMIAEKKLSESVCEKCISESIAIIEEIKREEKRRNGY